ncbi:Os05g0223400 [Oryza sativa Japonica Group]|uniref:Os05g0223400 protein n=1 Tax=Oryza sativa subsp. japonica TaxID=39947 RepID=A0A0P0WJI4_ORYSJ|nr:Os05g0223400 [Oryza sativa Japonica Group]
MDPAARVTGEAAWRRRVETTPAMWRRRAEVAVRPDGSGGRRPTRLAWRRRAETSPVMWRRRAEVAARRGAMDLAAGGPRDRRDSVKADMAPTMWRAKGGGGGAA